MTGGDAAKKGSVNRAKRCAFLTMDSTEGWSIDADLGIAPLEARNWTVDWIPWRTADVPWDRYDAVYIGVPWDYPADVQRFLSLLERIDRSRAVLVNDLSLVRWSLAKTYLRDLEQRGADIVPSLWYDRMPSGELAGWFERLATRKLIVKPVVSTNATDTFLMTDDSARAEEDVLLRTFRDRALVVQPFIASIVSDGEYSLFYFGNEFSHAIRKRPKRDDFRVQEEHGAEICPTEPEPPMIEAADRVLRLVDPTPVYARVDFVRGADGRFLLMELELIEPSMYLRMHPAAPERFAAAFERYVAAASADRRASARQDA
jgi:hypothetical protein